MFKFLLSFRREARCEDYFIAAAIIIATAIKKPANITQIAIFSSSTNSFLVENLVISSKIQKLPHIIKIQIIE